jgi:TrmH family RNA methyltransferase
MRLSKGDAKYLRSLQQKKVRDREKKFVVEGWRALGEVLHSQAGIEYVALSPSGRAEDFAELVGELHRRGIPIKEAEDATLARATSTVQPQGVLALVAQRTFTVHELLTERATLLVAADAVSDPGNAGTLLRTCDWFGTDGVMLGSGSAELYNEKVVRSSVGSLLHLPVADDVDLTVALGEARHLGFTLIAASGDAPASYLTAPYGPKNLFVFGSEAHGLSGEVRGAADLVVGIPRYGRVESLNVGVACGILLAHLRASMPPPQPR